MEDLFGCNEFQEIIDLLIGRTKAQEKETIEDIALRNLIETRVRRKLAAQLGQQKGKVSDDPLYQVPACIE